MNKYIMILTTYLLASYPCISYSHEVSSLTCADGQVPKQNGGVWSCSDDDNSGGDITSVRAGIGLVGGGTTGDTALSVQNPLVLSYPIRLDSNKAVITGNNAHKYFQVRVSGNKIRAIVSQLNILTVGYFY